MPEPPLIRRHVTQHPDLWHAAETEARRQGLSLSLWIEEAIAAHLSEEALKNVTLSQTTETRRRTR